ncbi:MAG: pilus assembly protein PilM [Lachnospiraceae bacterium]|nr:pilus assembly protein PilM [Lachnospiraceae bacterium]
MANIITATIGTTKLKMCELDCTKTQPYIEKAVTVDLPQGYASDGRLLDIDGLTALIKDVLIRENMEAKEITFVLKCSKVVYKEVYTPVLKGKKLKEFIAANASDYFPMDINDYIIADKIISTVEAEDQKQLRVGLYAAAKETVEAYYKLAEKLGLTIKNIESYNNATVSFLSRQVEAETSVVIYVHDDSTTVNIYKNNILELQRNVPYGRDLVVKSVMENMEIGEEEAGNLLRTKGLIHSTFDGHTITESLRYFVNGIIRVVDYYTSRSAENTIEKVYLTGEAMNILGLESLLVNEFFHNTEQIKKFRYIGVASNFRFEASMIAKYISCVGGIYDPVHFQSDIELQKKKNDRSKAYLLIGLVASLIVGIVMLAIPFLERLTYKNDIDSKKTQIEGLKGVEIIVDDYYNSVDKVKDVNNFVNMTVSPNDYILEFIKALEKGMPSHISVRSLSINNGQVNISASTSTKQTVAKFITQLKSIPGIQNPVVPSCAESKDGYGVISTTFSVSFTFNADIVKYLEDKPIEGEENSEAIEEEVQ